MFVSRALYVVFKTTGGKAWNPPTGLKPLSETQKRNRRKNIEQTLKNNSVLKMAASQQPEVPTRLYKHLPNYHLLWMKKKLDQARDVLSWQAGNAPNSFLQKAGKPAAGPVAGLPSRPALPYELRVKALAEQLQRGGGSSSSSVSSSVSNSSSRTSVGGGDAGVSSSGAAPS